MTHISEYSTGDALADQAIQIVIVRFEAAFPDCIIGYYVEGSYADQTAISTSDLDLIIVFGAQFATVAELSAAQQLVTGCAADSAVELDITLLEETHLYRQADPMFKLGARLLYGTDIRAKIPLLPIETWARQRMHAAYWLMINVLKRSKPVTAPLTLPQPNVLWLHGTHHAPNRRQRDTDNTQFDPSNRVDCYRTDRL